MWPFSKKTIDVPQIDLDGTELKNKLRETYHSAPAPGYPMAEDELKRILDMWMRKLPDAFRDALRANDGVGRSEVWIFEDNYGMSTRKFQYASSVFAASLKRCLGLNAKVFVSSAGATKSITLKTKELKKFFETPEADEDEKILHQMGIYR